MIDFTKMWSGLDWGVIVLYFVFIIAVGLTMRRRASKNMKSYFVAARRLTIPVLIGVGAASWIDSWSIVGLAEYRIRDNVYEEYTYTHRSTALSQSYDRP